MPPGKTHEEGMAQWCHAAGPSRINTDFALKVFEDVRWGIMTHSIDRSQSSILGDEEWLTVPWQSRFKDSLQLLYDHGFAIGNLLEQIHYLAESHRTANVNRLSSSCLDLLEQIEGWYKKVWGTFDEQLVLLMGGLFEATNMVYYWYFKICLNEALLTLHPASSQMNDPNDTEREDSAQHLANIALQRSNDKLASDIVLAAPFFSGKETAWLGPQRILFPLKKAIVVLGKAQSPLFCEGQAVLMQMVKRLRTC